MELAPPEVLVKLAEWLEDLEEAQSEDDWDGVGSVAEAIRNFLKAHEATGSAKLYGGKGEAP